MTTRADESFSCLDAAMFEGLAVAMAEDSSVVLVTTRGTFPAGFMDRPKGGFDERRIRRVPPQGSAMGALCAGAAVAGLRPVLDLTAGLLPGASLEHLEIQASALYYRTGQRLRCPVVCCVDAAHPGLNGSYSRLMTAPGLKGDRSLDSP